MPVGAVILGKLSSKTLFLQMLHLLELQASQKLLRVRVDHSTILHIAKLWRIMTDSHSLVEYLLTQ